MRSTNGCSGAPVRNAVQPPSPATDRPARPPQSARASFAEGLSPLEPARPAPSCRASILSACRLPARMADIGANRLRYHLLHLGGERRCRRFGTVAPFVAQPERHAGGIAPVKRGAVPAPARRSNCRIVRMNVVAEQLANAGQTWTRPRGSRRRAIPSPGRDQPHRRIAGLGPRIGPRDDPTPSAADPDRAIAPGNAGILVIGHRHAGPAIEAVLRS